jgi:hypothetical protein
MITSGTTALSLGLLLLLPLLLLPNQPEKPAATLDATPVAASATSAATSVAAPATLDTTPVAAPATLLTTPVAASATSSTSAKGSGRKLLLLLLLSALS